jgi:hypothetical protein
MHLNASQNLMYNINRKHLISSVKYCLLIAAREHAVAQFVEALGYKPESRGFDSRLRHWNFFH